jgi:nucleotide-binding universal stress UspA family protein
MLPYRTLLVTLDGSELAARALPEAERVAQLFDATLIVLRVVTDEHTLHLVPETLVDQVAEYTAQLREQQRQEVSAALDAVVAQLAARGVRAAAVVAAGEPAAAILETAGKAGADLIVMSTHGRTGLARLLYGSVAEQVLHAAPCPVLLIHAAEHSGNR